MDFVSVVLDRFFSAVVLLSKRQMSGKFKFSQHFSGSVSFSTHVDKYETPLHVKLMGYICPLHKNYKETLG